MRRSKLLSRHLLAPAGAALLLVLVASPAFAHEARTVAGYDMEVGLIGEPVFVGDKSGLELSVMKNNQPVAGLEATIKATVAYGSSTRDLPVSPRDGAPGWYESIFIPTAAGAYTFHLTGTIEGQAIDESFSASPSGFGSVEESAGGQFPNQFPAQAELAAQAAKGARAGDQISVALGLGAAGLVAGVIAIGIALAGRRRHA